MDWTRDFKNAVFDSLIANDINVTMVSLLNAAVNKYNEYKVSNPDIANHYKNDILKLKRCCKTLNINLKNYTRR
jgi:hypothetical protein